MKILCVVLMTSVKRQGSNEDLNWALCALCSDQIIKCNYFNYFFFFIVWKNVTFKLEDGKRELYFCEDNFEEIMGE